MFKLHVRRTLFFAILGLVLALIGATITPKIYEGRTELLVGEQARGPGIPTLTDDVKDLLERGSAKSAQSERQLLRSVSVLAKAVERVDPKLLAPGEFEKLYAMYDVVGSERRTTEETEGSVAQIRVKAYDPETAARIADEVANVYNDERQRISREANQTTLAYLKAMTADAQKDMQAKQAAYRDYRNQARIVNPKMEGEAITKNVTDLESQVQLLRAEVRSQEAEIAKLNSQIGSMPQMKSDSSSNAVNPVVTQLNSSLADSESRLATLRTTYEEDSIQIRQVKDLIANIEQQLREERKKLYSKMSFGTTPNQQREILIQQKNEIDHKRAANVTRLSNIDAMIARQREEIGRFPITEAKMSDYAREYELAEGSYRRLKLQESDIANRSDTATKAAQVLRNAQPDRDPVAPNTTVWALVGLLAGTALGLVFSFGLESLKLRVHTSTQLAELTGLPIAASVPMLPKGRASRLLHTLSRSGIKPHESFRYMAFSLLAKDFAPPKVMMFTGVGTGVGSSTSATQFAMAMAATGTRTLLVDGNVRRPSITRAFDLTGKSGLSELLNNKLLPSEGADVVVPTKHENLMLLPSGAPGDLGFADVQTSQLEAVLSTLKGKADVIVVDLPPSDVVSDASRLAKYADDVYLIVSATSTPYRAIPIGYEILVRAGAKNVSLILTHGSPQEEAFSGFRNLASLE